MNIVWTNVSMNGHCMTFMFSIKDYRKSELFLFGNGTSDHPIFTSSMENRSIEDFYTRKL